MLITLLLALLVILGDQISKMQIVQNMQPGQDIPVIDGILHLHYAQNNGAAFSMLPGMWWVFALAAAAAALAIIIYIATRKTRMHWLCLMSLGFILGGALGNLIDRVRTVDHHVIDFIYVKVINFAIFNVADSGVTVGAILLCVYLLFIHEKFMKKLRADKPEETVGPEGGQAQG